MRERESMCVCMCVVESKRAQDEQKTRMPAKRRRREMKLVNA